jgi:AAA+ superfamily predicted ATPase
MASTPGRRTLRLPVERTHARALPDVSAPGVAWAIALPNPEMAAAWDAIILPADAKARLARQAASTFRLRQRVNQTRLPLHGVIALFGRPGTGKSTLAMGLADRVAQLVTGIGSFIFVVVDTHGLTSSALGKSQKAVDRFLREQVPIWASEGPVVVLLDEVETIVADRGKLSLEANPIDVHRATDAALVGLDHVAHNHKNVLFIVTSNFTKAVDDALMSRLDLAYEMPLPDREAVRAILVDTLQALGEAFPGAAHLAADSRLDQVVSAALGLDGRRIRKLVAAACSIDATAAADPDRLSVDALVAAAAEAKATA